MITQLRQTKNFVLGGDKKLTVDDSKAKEFVTMALKYLSSKAETEIKYKLNEIKKVSKRVVAGSFWLIDADVFICNTFETCYDKDNIIDCQLAVLDQPWLVDGLQINVTCKNDDNLYSFKPTIEFQESVEKRLTQDHILKTFQQFVVKHKKVYRTQDEYNFRLKVSYSVFILCYLQK